MSDAVRVTAQEIRPRVQSGDALLVCAYGSDEKFNANHLEGAISFSDFSGRVSVLPKDTELVFYCG